MLACNRLFGQPFFFRSGLRQMWIPDSRLLYLIEVAEADDFDEGYRVPLLSAETQHKCDLGL